MAATPGTHPARLEASAGGLLLGAVAAGPALALTAARWGTGLLVELTRLPGSVRALREAVDGLTALPEHVERLAVVLESTSDTLERHVPELSETVVAGIGERVEQLAASVDGLDDRLAHLASTLEASVPSLAGLPDRLAGLDETVQALDAQVSVLRASLGELLPRLTDAVDEELPARLEHLDEVVSRLGDTVTAAVGSIPGVRRSLTRESG